MVDTPQNKTTNHLLKFFPHSLQWGSPRVYPFDEISAAKLSSKRFSHSSEIVFFFFLLSYPIIISLLILFLFHGRDDDVS